MTDLYSFQRAYIACADFADCGPDSECCGADWADETIQMFNSDAAFFFLANKADIAAYEDETGSDAGHDLWYTRVGHGCGFWEHDTPAAARLDKAARALGNIDLYLGDDGKAHAA